LDDRALRFLGRAHDAREGLRALETARRSFDRVSFDLIYALPGQSEVDWGQELARALSLGTGHLSLYQLTIEPGTRFAALAAKGELAQTDPDHAACLYEITQVITEAAGLPAYEISNHARPGEESRHNLAYWRYQPYLGVGPGAHGRRRGAVTQRHKKPENWLAALARNGHGIAEESLISPADRGVEALLMGLRLREGVDLAQIAETAATEPQFLVNRGAVARLAAQGLLVSDANRLCVTPAGMLLLDAILAEIVEG
ncbi:MAG: coproporphyrinogen III oxidase, partial [Pseudomonadota bacterium]|nr:coproporphyrinogen III oxidase [Pseudomonadota bacterium]